MAERIETKCRYRLHCYRKCIYSVSRVKQNTGEIEVTNATRQQTFRDELKKKKLKRVEVIVHECDVAAIRKSAARMNRKRENG